MNELLKLFAFVLIGLSTSAVCAGKEWHGIVPMHSTREDVNRMLGTSPDFNKLRANYSVENEDVYIVFSNDESYQECARRIPKDTVLLIQVTPKTNLQLSDLGLDKAALRTFEPSSPPGIGYEGFIDDANGVVVRTLKGRVDQIAYVANSEDRKLCPEYYENIEGALKLIVDFFPASLTNTPTFLLATKGRVLITSQFNCKTNRSRSVILFFMRGETSRVSRQRLARTERRIIWLRNAISNGSSLLMVAVAKNSPSNYMSNIATCRLRRRIPTQSRNRVDAHNKIVGRERNHGACYRQLISDVVACRRVNSDVGCFSIWNCRSQAP